MATIAKLLHFKSFTFLDLTVGALSLIVGSILIYNIKKCTKTTTNTTTTRLQTVSTDHISAMRNPTQVYIGIPTIHMYTHIHIYDMSPVLPGKGRSNKCRHREGPIHDITCVVIK